MSAISHAAASTLTGGDPVLTKVIAEGLQLIHVLQVYTSAMVTLAVWDWLVCIKMEWTRVWKREWSIIKCLYIWTRYYGLICFAINLWLFNSEFTAEKCKTLHYLIAATCMWVVVGSEAILAIRTYAFLGKKLWVGILMGTMLLGEIGYLLFVSIAGVAQIPPAFDVGPCTASDAPGKHIVSGFWLAPVAFDLICTSLTVSKAFMLRGAGVRSDLISIFVREGLFYFVAVAGVNVLNAGFMIQSSNPSLQNLNSFLALVLSQVLCCRLVLNLRSRGSPGSAGTSGHNSRSDSHPTFNTHPTFHSPANYNIPLHKYRPGVQVGGIKSHHDDTNSDELYDGAVKVQIDVERDAQKA